jgi:hypothetical protein
MKFKPLLFKSLFQVVSALLFFQTSIAQDSSATKLPMYNKLDSTTDSISAIGERPVSIHPDSVKVFVNNSYSVSVYIIIAVIVGAVFSVVFSSLSKKKEIEFKKWNLENREKLKNSKK